MARHGNPSPPRLNCVNSKERPLYDAISIGGEAIFRSGIGPLLPGCEHVSPPDNRRCPFKCGAACNLKCADYIEYVLEKEGDVAAVIGETVRSTPFIPPPDYWKRVRAACDKHGALLILDEIPHCLGRTGKMFTCEHFDVVPDMLVIGKGLGGGIFPLAALIARDDVNKAAAHKALGHYTHEKNPVACAVALATIDVIESEGLLQNAAKLGKYAVDRMRAMMKKHPLIGDVRELGLLMGIELVKNRKTMEHATDKAEQVMYRSLSKGLNFKLTMDNILTLTPALTITKPEMDQALTSVTRLAKSSHAKVASGILPDVEGGIRAARKERSSVERLTKSGTGWTVRKVFSAGLEAPERTNKRGATREMRNGLNCV